MDRTVAYSTRACSLLVDILMPKQPKQSLIYVHGTNGSGKSTLARYLLMCAGGIKAIKQHVLHL